MCVCLCVCVRAQSKAYTFVCEFRLALLIRGQFARRSVSLWQNNCLNTQIHTSSHLPQRCIHMHKNYKTKRLHSRTLALHYHIHLNLTMALFQTYSSQKASILSPKCLDTHTHTHSKIPSLFSPN